jgi:isoamylase
MQEEFGAWRRWIDTSLGSPHDIVPWDTALPVSGRTYRAAPRSVVVLFEEIVRKRTRREETTFIRDG